MTILSIFRRGSTTTTSDLAPVDAVAVHTTDATIVSTEASVANEASVVNTPTTATLVNTELILSSDTQFDVVHGDHDNLLVNMHVRAPTEIAEAKRESLDLVCVLDISSSMNGASKLDLCKNTLDFVVSQLSPSDRLGLVTFSNTVKTVRELTRMDEEGKRSFKESVKNVRASGMTNLSGGLLKGVAEVMGQRSDGGAPNQIQSILLLTDGQANVGIKDKTEMVEILRNSSAEHKCKSTSLPFSVFTFGFGSDHNVELLKAISDCANGVYYFIDDLDKVGNAFGDCLGGLLSVVAQNTMLTITGSNGSSVGEVFTDFPNKWKADKAVEVEIGDLYAEEERNILSSINLKFPPKLLQAKEDTQMEICKVTLSCINLVTKKSETKEMGIYVSVRPKNLPLSDAEQCENLTIEIHYNRWETSKTMQKADEMCDDLRFKDQAVQLLDERLNKLKDLATKSPALSSSSTPSQQREYSLLTEMQTDLVQCRRTVERTNRGNLLQKKGFMQNKMNKLGRERGNSFTNYSDDEDDLAEDDLAESGAMMMMDGVSSKKTRSVFETKSKQASKSRASNKSMW